MILHLSGAPWSFRCAWLERPRQSPLWWPHWRPGGWLASAAPCQPCWPTVIGYYLILLVGRRGVLGPGLAELGINLIFSWQGAVVAATVVVFPLIYKSARASLEQVDKHLEDAARTLGASEWRVFVSVSLPLAWKGIFAGIMLAFARGMGEFGATLMIAGNIPGKTQTLALAIYDAFQAGNDLQASWLVVITSAVCVSLLMAAELLVRLKRRR